MPIEEPDARPAAAVRSGMYLYYRHSLPVRVMHWINVIALTILLAGLTDELFELTISPNSLGAIGVNDVYVTPESRAHLYSEPLLDDYYTLSAQLALESLTRGSAVVYEVHDGKLRDITAPYSERIRRKPGG